VVWRKYLKNNHNGDERGEGGIPTASLSPEGQMRRETNGGALGLNQGRTFEDEVQNAIDARRRSWLGLKKLVTGWGKGSGKGTRDGAG